MTHKRTRCNAASVNDHPYLQELMTYINALRNRTMVMVLGYKPLDRRYPRLSAARSCQRFQPFEFRRGIRIGQCRILEGHTCRERIIASTARRTLAALRRGRCALQHNNSTASVSFATRRRKVNADATAMAGSVIALARLGSRQNVGVLDIPTARGGGSSLTPPPKSGPCHHQPKAREGWDLPNFAAGARGIQQPEMHHSAPSSSNS